MSEISQNLDFRTVTLEHNEKLDEYFEEWTRRFNEDSDRNGMAWNHHL